LAPLSVAAAPCGTSTSGGKTTVTFCYTGGAQTWTVPAGVKSATFTVFGAAGGVSNAFTTPPPGGLGGKAVATIALVPGSTVTIVVGGVGATPPNVDGCLGGPAGGAGGFNGGGAGGASGGGTTCGGSGGGGASDIRIGGAGLGNRVLVAGGGGGASNALASGGGAGGGNAGSAGGNGGVGAGVGGGGGTQIAGGTGGISSHNGANGAAGVGGAGATNDSAGVGAGGAGGGWFGGGGGGAESDGNAGGGGGGSAHGPAGVVLTAGVRAGVGLASVTYSTPLPAASALAPSIPWLPVAGLVVGLGLVWFGLRRRRAPAA
jgi:hypothetical protein